MTIDCDSCRNEGRVFRGGRPGEPLDYLWVVCPTCNGSSYSAVELCNTEESKANPTHRILIRSHALNEPGPGSGDDWDATYSVAGTREQAIVEAQRIHWRKYGHCFYCYVFNSATGEQVFAQHGPGLREPWDP